jgi:FkbM family methyltransferase
MTIEEWEKELVDWVDHDINLVCKYLKPNDTFVDIGANTGIFTKEVLDRINFELNKIILFEPVPKYYNECINKFGDNDKFIIENIGLSDDTNDKTIYVSHLNYGYNKIYRDGMEIHPHDKILIKCNTFSNWIKDKNINKVDFIKIDTEGHDTNIINGMYQWLDNTNNRPTILYECLWYQHQEEDVMKFMIEKYGYQLIKDEISHNTDTLFIHPTRF